MGTALRSTEESHTVSPTTAADAAASGALYLLGFVGLVGCLVQAIRALTAAPAPIRSHRHRATRFTVN